jgi:hypothetical protein
VGRINRRRIIATGVSSFLAISLITVSAGRISAWNRSEIEWKTIKTEHFEIQFHEGGEWAARQVAAIAEEIYVPITDFYQYRPGGTISINIFDKEDDIEGATYYYLNRIDISASGFDFHLRGSANWLRNVVTHEFTHMVSVQLGMKLPMRFPAFYLQWIEFEKEKRPDVMTGYPIVQASAPVSMEIMPNWFAEGIAQYQYESVRNDIWDSHRDMLLRMAVLEDGMLTLDEMGVFGKNSLESELVYNQGYALVLFIEERYGKEKLAELTEALSALYRWTFNAACKKVLGIPESKLYEQWKTEMTNRYEAIAARIADTRREGAPLPAKGFYNHFPVSDGAGGYFYLSNDGGDYSDLDLIHYRSDGTKKSVSGGVESKFDLSADGTRLCYGKRTKKNEHGYAIDDIYIYDIAKGKDRRVTRGLRATNTAFSPEGDRIACVVRGGGMERIAIIDADSGEVSYLTESVPDVQLFGLSWGKGGILVSAFTGSSRDIILIDPSSGSQRPVLATGADERDPQWDKEGNGFFYACDRTGIFNIYYHGIDGAQDYMVTNCLGGAIQPSPTAAGCLFALYGANGYELREISDWRSVASETDPASDDLKLVRLRETHITSPAVPSAAPTASGPSGDAAGGVESASDYGIQYSMLHVFPRFMIYNRKFRLGLYLDTGDLLDRQYVSVGGSINTDKEFDLSLMFETRQFKPTFNFSLFRVREYESFFIMDRGSLLELFTRYDLWDSYFAATFEFTRPSVFKQKEITIQYNHGEYGLNFEIWEHYDSAREFRGAVGWNYYKSNEFSLFFKYRTIRKERGYDINPRGGRNIDLEVTAAFNQLHSGEFEYAFMPVYDKNPFGRYRLKYEEYIALPYWKHTLTLKFLGAIIDNVVDDFFYLYLGSKDGLRGYTYFSVGGRKNVLLSAAYRFPFMPNIHWQLGSIYLDSIYGGVFAEIGKAWDTDEFATDDYLRDFGYEVRLKGFTFYSYPLAVTFEAAYGVDDHVYQDPFDLEMTFYEGKHWRYYGTLLFTF